MNRVKFYYNCTNLYDDLSNIFKKITEKHAPIKRKKVRGNNNQRTQKSYHE